MSKQKKGKKTKTTREPKVKLTHVVEWLDCHIKEYDRLKEKAVFLKDYLRVEGGITALKDFREDLELSAEE